MDFIFSDEQQQLRDSIQKYISKEYGFEARKAIMATAQGFSDKVWAQFADMGLLGVAFDEAHGGFGGSSVDTMLVMTELGRGIVVEPYFSTVVLGGSHCSRRLIKHTTVSTAPAAPSRWPMHALVELTASRGAAAPAQRWMAAASERSLSTVPVPWAFT